MSSTRPIMPMRRPRRPRVDEDIIKTERDNKKATGAEGENDFEEEKVVPLELPRVWAYASQRDLLNKKAVQRKIQIKNEQKLKENGDVTQFPFTRLPPEIRNEIYRYLIVSQARAINNPKVKVPINIGAGAYPVLTKYWIPGGIDTTILTVNKQLYSEASYIFYTENIFQVNLNTHSGFINYRVDVPATTTTRSLRSGRTVDMMKHTGLIYEHVVHRLRNIQFIVHVPDTERGYVFHRLHGNLLFYRQMQKLAGFLMERGAMEKGLVDDLAVYGKNWTVKFDCAQGEIGLLSLKILTHPLMTPNVMKTLRHGKASFTIDGPMPKGWKGVMKQILDNGGTIGTVTEGTPASEDTSTGYEMLTFFRSHGTLIPFTLVETEADRKRRAGHAIRRCRNCGGFHLAGMEDDSDDGFGYDSDSDYWGW